MATAEGVDGLLLDFIRWPLHWELECRDGGPRLPATSFDPETIREFNEWSGVDLNPDDPQGAAHYLTVLHPVQWTNFRCAVVTGIVRRVRDVVAPAGVSLGAFVVPIAEGDRRLLAGQDIASWDPFVDVLYPMTYHAILHRQPSWIAAVVDEMRRVTNRPVVPVVQITSDSAFAQGADWGPTVSTQEAVQAVRVALRSQYPSPWPDRGVAVVPGLGMSTELFRALAR